MIEFLFILCVIPISLLFFGIERKLTARFHNRVGPPIWQPFYDIAKLFQKGRSDSRAQKNIFFRLCPIVYFLSSILLFLFIPFSFISFDYDFILLIYITILCSGLYVLAGFSSNSPFGILGSMREIITMVAYEIVFALSVFSFMIAAGVKSIAAYPPGLHFLEAPLATICLLFVTILEIRITPFDTAEAETEILYGYKTEFSSRGLALIELSRYMKLLFFIFFITFLFFGPMHIVPFLLISLAMLFLLTLEKVTTPRYRVEEVFKFFIPVLALALIEITRLIIL